MIGLEKMPNPTNKPEEDTTGYQRQNTNMHAIQTGIDTCEPFYDEKDKIVIIPAGGIIEVNGSLFKIVEDIKLSVTPGNYATYWIAIGENNNGTSAQLVYRPGKWDSAKQGCYLSDGRRTLKWHLFGGFAPNRDEEVGQFPPYKKGLYTIRLKKGWYYIQLESGAGGADGADASGITGGSGGDIKKKGSQRSLDKIIFLEENKIIQVKVGGSGMNGSDGQTPPKSGTFRPGGGGGGGSGGGEETIFDIYTTGNVPGGKGGKGGYGKTGAEGGMDIIDAAGAEGGINGQDGGDCLDTPWGLNTTPHNYAYGGKGGRGKGLLGGSGGGGGCSAGGSQPNYGYNSYSGGNGGDGGDGGNLVDYGEPGGYCYIYPIGD